MSNCTGCNCGGGSGEAGTVRPVMPEDCQCAKAWPHDCVFVEMRTELGKLRSEIAVERGATAFWKAEAAAVEPFRAVVSPSEFEQMEAAAKRVQEQVGRLLLDIRILKSYEMILEKRLLAGAPPTVPAISQGLPAPEAAETHGG